MFVAGIIIADGGKKAPRLLQIESFKTEKEAINRAIDFAMTQQKRDSRESVRIEITKDGDYAEIDGAFTVFVKEMGKD